MSTRGRARRPGAGDPPAERRLRRFEEAARKEDEAAIERLFKLFPQIGRAEEGVDLLAKHLATQVSYAKRGRSRAGAAR